MKIHPALATAAAFVALLSTAACSLHGRSSAPSGSAEEAAPTEAASGGSGSPSGEVADSSAPDSSSIPALDPQTDEGAGKRVDVAKIAASPKSGSPYLGPKDALVVVNVFSDFQCPVCRRSADPIKQLIADFPGKVKVIFRHNALEMHGRSKPAALASMAAAKQGRFWPYYDRLFLDQSALDDASLRRDAEALGLDMTQWDKDVASPETAERLKQESAWAPSLGATGTPAFFINGLRQVGWGSYQGLKSMVQREITSAEQLVAGGTPPREVAALRIREGAVKNTARPGDPPVDAEAWVKVLTAD